MKSDIEKIETSSGRSWVGWSKVYGYQTSAWVGRLRLHIFHREDPGDAFHNHPWDFTTLPLTPYVEEVLDDETGQKKRQVVPAFRRTRRPAEHAHRIIGRWAGSSPHWHGAPLIVEGPVVTLCWRGPHQRVWEYLIVRAGRVYRFPWRRYLARADGKPRIAA